MLPLTLPTSFPLRCSTCLGRAVFVDARTFDHLVVELALKGWHLRASKRGGVACWTVQCPDCGHSHWTEA